MDYIDCLDLAYELSGQIIGMGKEEAIGFLEEQGYSEIRIASEDHDHYILTMDLHPLRFNLSIVDGIVIEAKLG